MREIDRKHGIGLTPGQMVSVSKQKTAGNSSQYGYSPKHPTINSSNMITFDTVWKAWDNYILRFDRKAEFLGEQAARAELVVEEKRNLYLEASRELKVMEKLKEKRKEEYRKEAGKA